MAKRLHDEPRGQFDGVINQEALGRYVDRIEALHVERDELTADIKAVYDEAKSAGFVTAVLRQIVRERRMEPDERHDHYALLDSYRRALGMLADTPLGEAAMARAAAPKPRAFAEQTLSPPRRRGRPRKPDPIASAREHLNGDSLLEDPLLQ